VAFVAQALLFVARNYDGWNAETTARKFPLQFQAGHLRHVHIHNQASGYSRGQAFEEVPPGSIRSGIAPVSTQQSREPPPHGVVVVNDGHVSGLIGVG
jgi:hypothetical protein